MSAGGRNLERASRERAARERPRGPPGDEPGDADGGGGDAAHREAGSFSACTASASEETAIDLQPRDNRGLSGVRLGQEDRPRRLRVSPPRRSAGHLAPDGLTGRAKARPAAPNRQSRARSITPCAARIPSAIGRSRKRRPSAHRRARDSPLCDGRGIRNRNCGSPPARGRGFRDAGVGQADHREAGKTERLTSTSTWTGQASTPEDGGRAQGREHRSSAGLETCRGSSTGL